MESTDLHPVSRHFRHWPMVLAILVLLLAVSGWWAPRVEPLRSWRIRQEKPLVDGIIMRIENLAFHVPRSGGYLLSIRSRWIGGNPNDHHVLRATLHASPDGPAIESSMWQVAIPQIAADGATLPLDWEFRINPTSAPRLYLRVYYRDPKPGSKEQSVLFDLPNLPMPDPNHLP